MSNKLILVQPGGYGDIFVCAPIAKWYADKGYTVYWPARQEYRNLLAYFDYVTPVSLSEEINDPDWLRSDVNQILQMISNKPYKVINLADRGPHYTAQRHDENFEQCKYRISEVPFTEKNNLVFSRNRTKEEALYNKLVTTNDYVFVHNTNSHGDIANLPPMKHPVVYAQQIPNFYIPDYYKIIVNAKEIYCVESAFHQFIDGIVRSVTPERYLLKRASVVKGTRYTISSNWKLDYIGKNSIVRG